MVEGARLESVYTRKGIEGSNPSVSALQLVKRNPVKGYVFFMPLGEQKGEQFLVFSCILIEKFRIKCVLFIFLSTSGASSSIMKAYSYGVQGYFIKPNTLEKLKSILHAMITYWSESQHPNK